jgi:hypothetical protein
MEEYKTERDASPHQRSGAPLEQIPYNSALERQKQNHSLNGRYKQVLFDFGQVQMVRSLAGTYKESNEGG